MTPIPQKVRKQIDSDQFYKVCALAGLHGHECDGRITMDHSIKNAGRQVQELWAITPVCEAAHGVDSYQGQDSALLKELRLWVALNRATMHDLVLASKAMNWVRELDRLNKKYGVFVPYVPTPSEAVEKL